MAQLCYNGRFLDTDTPVLAGINPAFKWGEGLFETMCLIDGQIRLEDRHWARLHDGAQRLGFNDAALQTTVLANLLRELALRNNCAESARLRLQVFREGAGLGFVAEAAPLDEADREFNERGWTIEVYPDARIAPDAFSMLKRSAYLPYLLAAKHAEAHGFDECFLLNTSGNITDGARTNLWWVRGGAVHTIPLSEGCVAGVMRAHLLEQLRVMQLPVVETACTMEDLLAADEIFLSNALKIVRWVGRFRSRTYGNTVARRIYEALPATF